jgi:hypothetical protein
MMMPTYLKQTTRTSVHNSVETMPIAFAGSAPTPAVVKHVLSV